MLLARGADYKIQNGAGETAADLGGNEIFTESLAQDQTANGGSDQNAIFLEASRSGDLETVQRLCNGTNVNCRDMEGRHSTPLHFAAGYNRVQVVEYLLSQGADVQAGILSMKQFIRSFALDLFYNVSSFIFNFQIV